jgi:hypothetical protein
VALESSVNQVLLALLISFWLSAGSAKCGWKYPIGFHIPEWSGLYKELVMTSTHLNAGYYGWRVGSVTQLEFQDGRKARIAPQLNAGSAAVQYLLAKLRPQAGFQDDIYGPLGFLAIYQQMFGDAWTGAAARPNIPPGWNSAQFDCLANAGATGAPTHPGRRAARAVRWIWPQ